MRAYESSPEWRALAPATHSTYRLYLQDLSRLGHIRAADVTRRGLIEVRNAIAAIRGDGAASGFVRAASAMFTWAASNDWLEHSPAALLKPLQGGHLPTWSMDHVRAANAALPEPLRRAVVLALHTAQRRGDLIAMRWADYDGEAVRVRQQKTGVELMIHASDELRAELATWQADATAPTILTDGKGKAWNGMQLSAHMAYHLAQIEGFPPGMNIHGLRKLAATRLADAGCTMHEIAAMTGHKTLGMVSLYTADADQRRLARAAVERLRTTADNQQPTPNK